MTKTYKDQRKHRQKVGGTAVGLREHNLREKRRQKRRDEQFRQDEQLRKAVK